MSYALLNSESIVINIISLLPEGASMFPNAVPFNGYPVGIGDEYRNGKFYRHGRELNSFGGLSQDEIEMGELLNEIYNEDLIFIG